MRKRKLLSCLLIGLVSFSLVSCGNKSNNGNGEQGTNNEKTKVIKEEALTTMPEQQLVTDYLKEYLQGGDKLYQEGMKLFNLYWKDKVDQEFIDKYNFKQFEGEYKIKDIYDVNLWFVPELNQEFFKINYKNMLREITVKSKDELETIRGTFDAEVVLSGENKIVIAIKPSDKYEYYCLKVDKQYSIGNKFKVTMDSNRKLFIE